MKKSRVRSIVDSRIGLEECLGRFFGKKAEDKYQYLLTDGLNRKNAETAQKSRESITKAVKKSMKEIDVDHFSNLANNQFASGNVFRSEL